MRGYGILSDYQLSRAELANLERSVSR